MLYSANIYETAKYIIHSNHIITACLANYSRAIVADFATIKRIILNEINWNMEPKNTHD